MEVDKTYSQYEIEHYGLRENAVKNVDYKVYEKKNKIYFFEELENNSYRLYTIINKRSFFL